MKLYDYSFGDEKKEGIETNSFNTDPNSLTMYTRSDVPVFSPIKGRVFELKELEDGIFSELMLGDGVVVEAEETPNVYSKIHSPISGTIIEVSNLKHTFWIKNDHMKLFIHIGLDTSKLENQGIEINLTKGMEVEVGQEIGQFVNEIFKAKEVRRLIIITVQNNQKVVQKNVNKKVNIQEEIFTVKR